MSRSPPFPQPNECFPGALHRRDRVPEDPARFWRSGHSLRRGADREPIHTITVGVYARLSGRRSDVFSVSPKRWRSDSPVTERAQLRNTIQVLPLVDPSARSAGPYGTRLSTVLLVRKDGQALFVERDIWTLQDGKVVKADPSSQRVHRFTLGTGTAGVS